MKGIAVVILVAALCVLFVDANHQHASRSSLEIGQKCIINDGADVRKSGPQDEDIAFCTMWKDNSCCRDGVTDEIESSNFDVLHGANWTACGAVSNKCLDYLKHLSCFEECSPYLAPWATGDATAPFAKVPVCATWAEQWFDACKDDSTCATNWRNQSQWTGSTDTSTRGCAAGAGACKSFGSVFPNAKSLLENLLGNSYTFVSDSTKCFKPWFVGDNTNGRVYHTAIASKTIPARTLTTAPSTRLPKSVSIDIRSPERLSGRAAVGSLGTYVAAVYVSASSSVFVADASNNIVDVLDAANLSSTLQSIDTTILVGSFSGSPFAIDAYGSVVAVALVPSTQTDDGVLVLINANTYAVLSSVPIGALPRKVTFTPDGNRILVANEGAASYSGDTVLVDPLGTVSIIDLFASAPAVGTVRSSADVLSAAAALTSASVRTVNFTSLAGVRIDNGVELGLAHNNSGKDIEPTFVVVSDDSTTAYVTCTSNNAAAVLDIDNGVVLRIMTFGSKDHLFPTNGIDATSGDGVTITNVPVRGLFQPTEGKVAYIDGKPYFITANGGGGHDGDYVALGTASVVLNSAVFRDADGLKAAYPGLKVHKRLGKSGSKYSELYTSGARSFAAWTAEGERLFDSGDEFERAIGWKSASAYNVANGVSDATSTFRGCQPGTIAVGRVGDRLYTFIGLTNCDGFFVYDVSDLTRVRFVQHVSTGGATGPSSLTFYTDAAGKPILLATFSYADNGRAAIFDINTLLTPIVEPTVKATSWSMRPPVPTARSDLTSTTIGDKIYVAGGCITDSTDGGDVCNKITNVLEVFDPLTGEWDVDVKPMPTARFRHTATAWAGKLIVMGGRLADDSALDSVEIYDPLTDDWTTLASLPVAVSDLASATIGDRVFAFGGWEATYAGTYNKTWEYNPLTNTWSVVNGAVLANGKGRGDFEATVLAGKVYAFGGYSISFGADWGDVVLSGELEVFDPETNKWSTDATMRMHFPRADKGCAALNNKIYLIAGETKIGASPYDWVSEAVADVEIYDPFTGEFTVAAEIPSVRMRTSAAAHGSSVYVFGGHSNTKAVQNLAEVLTIGDNAKPAIAIEQLRTDLRGVHAYVAARSDDKGRLANAARIADVEKRVSTVESQVGTSPPPVDAEDGDDDTKDIAIAALVIAVIALVGLIPISLAVQRVAFNRWMNQHNQKYKGDVGMAPYGNIDSRKNSVVANDP